MPFPIRKRKMNKGMACKRKACEGKACKGKVCKGMACKGMHMLGNLLLVLVILFCVPITVPRILGHQIYHVISGSMEPAIPMGSLVYTAPIAPDEIKPGDVIAFYTKESPTAITHRVVEHLAESKEYITKGDANEKKDRDPIPYDNYIGKVTLHVPYFGYWFAIFTSSLGKIMAGAIIALCIFLHLIANSMEKKKEF